ncbi:hypothetical protein [Bacillus thuringiensis]|nr:hypothetical protein [Bacillus thuringiensis]
MLSMRAAKHDFIKDVRQWQRPTFHRDSAEDCVAYAALKAEALSETEV